MGCCIFAIRGLFFSSSYKDSLGFLGANGKILRTDDLGDTWDEVFVDSGMIKTEEYFQFIGFIDDKNMIAITYNYHGINNALYNSSDRGETWSFDDSINLGSVSQVIQIINEGKSILFKNENGLYIMDLKGSTYKSVYEFDKPNFSYVGIRKYQFKSQNIGYILVSGLSAKSGNSSILRTFDEGKSWELIDLGDEFLDMQYINDSVGYIVNENSYYITKDYGSSFERQAEFIYKPKHNFEEEPIFMKLAISENGRGLIAGGGFSDLWDEGDDGRCVLIKVGVEKGEYEMIYDSLGLWIDGAHAINDSTYIVYNSEYGMVMKTEHCGGEFGPNYPWEDVIRVVRDGILLESKSIHPTNKLKLDLSSYTEGIYLIELILQNKEVVTAKLLVQK